MRHKESLRVAIRANVNALSEGKSIYTHGRRRVAHTARRKDDNGTLIVYVIRIRRSHSDSAQMESSFKPKQVLLNWLSIFFYMTTNA